MSSAAQSPTQPSELLRSERLEEIFARCFERTFATHLVGGATEPLYQPARGGEKHHRIYYRNDYFASALHEVAHWCLAGTDRRQQVDYGYWYASDGRDATAQRAFESVEYKPQALEWMFSRACGWRFRISADNLEACEGNVPDTSVFEQRVLAQVHAWQVGGLPGRAQQFFDALWQAFSAPRASGPHPAKERADGTFDNPASNASKLVFTLAELR